MDGLLVLAFTSLLLVSTVYVCLRRGRHGGLAGGDSTVLAPPGVAEPGMGRLLTLHDVAKHNTPNDLWLIINRKVYDFTEVCYFACVASNAFLFVRTTTPAWLWCSVSSWRRPDVVTRSEMVACFFFQF
jgi:Cytochrome b5-like Heme/Steroid binding domain